MNAGLWQRAYAGLDRITKGGPAVDGKTPRQEQVLALVRRGVDTSGAIARALGVSRSACMDLLRRMERNGSLVERVKATSNTPAVWEASS